MSGDQHFPPGWVPGVKRGDFRKGEKHPSARVTAEQVLLIREARGSHAHIGRQFGITAAAVGKIKRRETWGWLNRTIFFEMEAKRAAKKDTAQGEQENPQHDTEQEHQGVRGRQPARQEHKAKDQSRSGEAGGGGGIRDGEADQIEAREEVESLYPRAE